MKAKHHESLFKLADEISHLVSELPAGTKHPIQNRCSKIKVITKKVFNNMETEANLTSEQIADRYIAKKAIFEAMTQGRRLSLLDSREFDVSQFHTTICDIRKEIEDKNLPWDLKNQWITFGKRGKRCKEYWLERKAES